MRREALWHGRVDAGGDPAGCRSATLDLEGGAVRYVRYAGHEAIRGIDYLVRDQAGGRRRPASRRSPRGERRPLPGRTRRRRATDDIDYRFRLTVEGHADGRLDVRADGEAHSSFLTNRTGFVVLHPIIGVAGKPVTVTHKDGSTSQSHFPDLISPDQPILDIRALRHEVAPGAVRHLPDGGLAAPATPKPSSRWRTSGTGPTHPTRPTSARSSILGRSVSRPGPRCRKG